MVKKFGNNFQEKEENSSHFHQKEDFKASKLSWNIQALSYSIIYLVNFTPIRHDMKQKMPNTSKSSDVYTNTNKYNKNIFTSTLLLLYFGVHFIPNLGSIDVLGPQWLFLGIVNVIILAFLAYKKDQYEEAFTHIIKQPFSLLFIFLFAWSGFSMFFSINVIESWVCYVRFFVTLVAFINISVLLYKRLAFYHWIGIALSFILLFDAIVCLNTYISNPNDLSIDSLIRSINRNSGHKNILAAGMVIKLPFIFFCLYKGNFIERIFHMLSLTLGITVIFILNARAAYLSLAIISMLYFFGTIFMMVKTKTYEQHLFRVAYLAAPLLIAFFLAQSLLPKQELSVETQNLAAPTSASIQAQDEGKDIKTKAVYSDVVSRFTSISASSGSDSYRFMLWGHAWKYIAENPFMGCGYGNWKLASIPYEKEFIDDLFIPAHAHNDFLEFTAETGIIGGLAYLGLFVLLSILTFKTVRSPKTTETNRLIAIASFLSLIVYGVDAGLNFPIERPTMQMFLAFITAINLNSHFGFENREDSKESSDTTRKKLPGFGLYIMGAFLLLIPTLYILFSTNKSLQVQMKVIPDMKNEPMQIPLSEVQNAFPSIPNLTSSAQPIEGIVARYYSENKKYDEALFLLRKSINDNPYIYYNQFLMANLFYTIGNLDSAKYYAEIAYANRPRANTYYQTLVAIHAYRRDTASITQAFRTYTKYRNEPFAWNLYISGLLNALQRGTPQLVQLADSALKIFDPKGNNPANEQDYAILLKRKEEVVNNLNFTGTVAASPQETAALIEKATLVYNEGVAAFSKQDYKTAAAKFVQAAKINAFNYAIYENAGVSYFNLKDYRKAIVYFDKVISLNISKDGKSEFFKGVSLINLGNKEAGCKILQVAKSKNYAEANNIIAQYCNQ